MPIIPTTWEAEAGESIEPGREAEVAVSQDRAIALQPGQQSRNSVSNKQTTTTKQWSNQVTLGVFSLLDVLPK